MPLVLKLALRCFGTRSDCLGIVTDKCPGRIGMVTAKDQERMHLRIMKLSQLWSKFVDASNK
jgi:hypothetical protein